jgi:hypothetical protein
VDFREKTLDIDGEIFKVCLEIKIYSKINNLVSLASNMGYSWTG